MRKISLAVAAGFFVMFGSAASVEAATTYFPLSIWSKENASIQARQSLTEITDEMKARRQRAQQQDSIPQYFKQLAAGSLRPQKVLQDTDHPIVLYQHINNNPAQAGESGSVTPVKITKEEFLAKAPTGPMYFMANWWCSAAAVYWSYTPDAATVKKLGIYSGDCTNPNASITGNFDPQSLGRFDPSVPLTFTLRNVDPQDNTIIEKKSTAAGVCDVDYYKSLGHRNVYGAIYSCDDGFNIGVRDDIQFGVFVFPKNWPNDSNVEAVLKKLSSDEDNDGLKDGDEYYTYQTSPLDKDSDGDGYNDKTEVQTKHNPLGPGPATASQLLRWSRLKNPTNPVISNLSVSFAPGQAIVRWTTDVPADGIVNWGTTSAYGTHKSDFAFTSGHVISFPVSAGTLYHYAVRACSTGPNSKCTTTPDFTFTTPGSEVIPPVLSAIAVSVQNNYATVSWTTDSDSDTSINWGTTSAYGSSSALFTMSRSHSRTFAVTNGITYHYAVRSCTPQGLCTSSGDRTFVATAGTTTSTPVISNLAVNVSNNVATVSWTTNITADGIVNWGTTTAYGTHKSDFAFTGSHAISFPVNSGTLYHYAVRACTPASVCSATADATFSTPAGGPVAPTISNIAVNYNGNYAIVSWNTNVNADGIVNWGATTAYGSYVSDFAFTGSHAISIYTPAGATYHYAIRGCTNTSPSLCTTTPDATFTR